ncbi:hypothetical protein SAMN06265222_105142 [Neorhodopirellula lusitana]|uniref:Uncharacterized protein n=1 Tax=Neorhodopirellula lusitana TaxID=445327 RepID=A0ABY1Q4P8_9BACT|nr:hypothetical protein SAMN06265222_105142 [Neorhodopirellula lusitana]
MTLFAVGDFINLRRRSNILTRQAGWIDAEKWGQSYRFDNTDLLGKHGSTSRPRHATLDLPEGRGVKNAPLMRNRD